MEGLLKHLGLNVLHLDLLCKIVNLLLNFNEKDHFLLFISLY